MNEQAKAGDTVAATLTRTLGAVEAARAGGVYHIECRDKDGNLKWTAESHNLVVNVGLQDMNAKYFTGSSYTATWYLGLYGAASSNNPAAGDTASSHAGWTEITPYSNATRPTCTFGTPTTANPSVATNSASPRRSRLTRRRRWAVPSSSATAQRAARPVRCIPRRTSPPPVIVRLCLATR